MLSIASPGRDPAVAMLASTLPWEPEPEQPPPQQQQQRQNRKQQKPGKQPHAARNLQFVSWLVETFGLETLRGDPGSEGVLDIAGGRGAVAFALQATHGTRATLVDPKPLAGLRGRDRKVLRRQPANHPAPGRFRHVRAMLDPMWESTTTGANLLRSCSIMVGCHPDEATEAIVDACLKYGKPFAVLPCCVFPNLFPDRRLTDGRQVRTVQDFVEYLRQKHPTSIETCHLPFEGRNTVVFRRCGTAPQPERSITVASSVSAAGGPQWLLKSGK